MKAVINVVPTRWTFRLFKFRAVIKDQWIGIFVHILALSFLMFNWLAPRRRVVVCLLRALGGFKILKQLASARPVEELSPCWQ